MTPTFTTTTLSMRTFALFAVIVIIGPAAFMATTPKAHAIVVENIVNDSSWTSIQTAAKTAYSAVKEAITAVASVTTAAKETALVIEKYVLQPLAYVTTGNLLKKITSSILGFVGGKNGLGKPLYIQDMRAYVQNVGDVEAYTFLAQFQKNSNSPFAGALSSSLRADYLQGTSLAGFFAANKSTLDTYSSNPKGFVAGNWDLGGWSAFLGLATVDQNNPWLAYLPARDQLARQTQTAQTAKLAQAIGNQNFLSWCGTAGGTPAGGSGTTYDATTGLSTDVTTSPEFNAVVGGGCDNPDANGVCPGGSSDFSILNCPSGNGIEKVGDRGCGCTIDTGCTNLAGDVIADGKGYVLPTDYSCPSGATFDSASGGCTGTLNGEPYFAYALNAQGNPAYSSDMATNDAGGTSGGTGSIARDSSVSGTAGQILTSKINSLKGSDATNYADHLTWSGSAAQDGQCWSFVRNALCSDGYSTCTGNGQASVGILKSAGFTAVATDISAADLPGKVQEGYVVGVAKGSSSNGSGYNHVEMYTGGQYVSDTIQGARSNPYKGQPSVVYTVWKPPAKTSLAPQSRQIAAVYAGPPASKPSFFNWVGSGLSYAWRLLPFTGPQKALAGPEPIIPSNLTAAASNSNTKGTIYLDPGLTSVVPLSTQTSTLQKVYPDYTIKSVDSSCSVPSGSTVISYSAGGSCLKPQMNSCSDCYFILVDANNNNGALSAVKAYAQAHPNNLSVYCTSGYVSDICSDASLGVSPINGTHGTALSNFPSTIDNTDPSGTGPSNTTNDPTLGDTPDNSVTGVSNTPNTVANNTTKTDNTDLLTGGTPDTSSSITSLAAATGGCTTAGGCYGGGTVGGLKPGDPCTKSDGTSGRIQTPGSIIKDYLSSALKATSLDKLVAGAGDLSTQINGIIGDVGTVMKTVDTATNLFGGSSSGLLAFSGNSAYTSPFADYLNSPSYMGLTTASVYNNPTTNSATTGDLAARLADYQAAWGTINRTANDASATLNKLITSCPAESAAAQYALADYVTPTFADYATAKANIDAANGLIAQTAADASSGTDDGAYTNDILLQSTQPPAAADVADAQARAQVDGTAVADEANALSISNGTTVDKMNMLHNNGEALLSSSVCTSP